MIQKRAFSVADTDGGVSSIEGVSSPVLKEKLQKLQ